MRHDVPMHEPATPYLYERIAPSANDLSSWTVNVAHDSATGPCPKCGHVTTTALNSTAIAQGVAPDSDSPGFVRLFECACDNTHLEGETARLKCGRWWLARVNPSGPSPQIVPSQDDSMLAAARALAEDQPE